MTRPGLTRPGPLDVVDVFVYTVVLGLFAQFFPEVISESFIITLFTAVLLKLVLELVTWAKKSLVARIRSRRGVRRALNAVVLILVLMLARGGTRRLLGTPGAPTEPG
jgi:hypothetical protein